MKQLTFALLATAALSSAAWAESPTEREMHSFDYVQQVGNHATVEQVDHQDTYHDEHMSSESPHHGHHHKSHHHGDHKEGHKEGHHKDGHHKDGHPKDGHHEGHHHHHHKDGKPMGKKPADAATPQ